MDATRAGATDLNSHVERQLRVQERQLAVARLAVVGVALVAIVIFRDALTAFPWLVGLAVAGILVSGLTMLLVGRFPAREVGVVATAADLVIVTLAIYVEPMAIDAFLFYFPVVLGVALRFGVGSALWASVVASFMYASVVLLAAPPDTAVRNLLVVRIGYLLGLGLATGLFARVVIGRAEENANLQLRLAEEERERARAREAELLSQLAREFGSSLELSATADAVIRAAAPLLGELSWLMVVEHDGEDRAEPRLVLAAADGRDPERVERLVAHLSGRRLRVGEGLTGAAAATVLPIVAGGKEPVPVHAGDPDGVALLGLRSLVAAPIVSRGQVRGVLVTASAGTPLLGEGENRLAMAIAERAGPALENAALWADLQEQVRREQRAQRVKDDFLSIVSHELRTPLTSIQGYSQLLEARMRDSASPKELSQMRVIRSQVARMRRLVDDLLDVSRIDRRGGVSVEPEQLDLADEVREAVARTEREHPDRPITVEVPHKLPVQADRDRIGQVLTNLLDNALKYSPDGGPVTVRARSLGGDWLELTVADTGVGIDPADAELIFERFYQVNQGEGGGRRFGGLGLGLYITRAIVRSHGGEITAEPNREAGKGTVMRVRLPRRARVPEALRPVTDETPPFVVRRR
ncbi:MAG TPA: ATP-binding protein [candidate division Zixibacteria bacterium]|nr:ATP-binding protein [candidate division Zixibacteria bacterium]